MHTTRKHTARIAPGPYAGLLALAALGLLSLAAALGPARFAAAHARGAALSPMQAAEYALSVCRAPAA